MMPFFEDWDVCCLHPKGVMLLLAAAHMVNLRIRKEG